MVSKASSVNRGVCEFVAHSVHLYERGLFGGISVIICECAFCCGWDCRGLTRHKFRIYSFSQFFADERIDEPGVVGPSSYAAAHNVRDYVKKLKLLLSLETNYRLVSKGVVERRCQEISRAFCRKCVLDGFADRSCPKNLDGSGSPRGIFVQSLCCC